MSNLPISGSLQRVMKKKPPRPAKRKTQSAAPTDFDSWLAGRFADGGPFTALVIVMSTAGSRVEPIASTYAHVVGGDIAWPQMAGLLDGTGTDWNAVVIFAAAMDSGGALPDESARLTLRRIEEEILRDRRTINAGHFFDRLGRRMKLEDIGGAQ